MKKSKEKTIPVILDIDKDVLLALCLRAHDLDMTLNRFVGSVLYDYIKENKKISNFS